MGKKKRFTKGWWNSLNSEMKTVGVCHDYWTPEVDLSDVITLVQGETNPYANKALEVENLSAQATIAVGADFYTVDNGNVVVFNLSGNCVQVIGGTLVP